MPRDRNAPNSADVSASSRDHVHFEVAREVQHASQNDLPGPRDRAHAVAKAHRMALLTTWTVTVL